MKKIMVLVFFTCLISSVSYSQSRGYSSGFPHAPAFAPPPVYVEKDAEKALEDFTTKANVEIINKKNKGNKVIVEFKLKNMDDSGFIMIFDNLSIAHEEHDKILNSNKLGEHHSWSYKRNRLVLVLPFSLSKEKAKELRDVFYNEVEN